MINPQADLLFPPRVIPSLASLRSADWQTLVAELEGATPGSLEQAAFVLMMARLCVCSTCSADSYRAIHGCVACATQSLKRFHGSDQELLTLFNKARAEVNTYLDKENSSQAAVQTASD